MNKEEQQSNKSNETGFIVGLWERVFFYLSFISIFYFIRKIKKKVTPEFVEKWVLFNTLTALFSPAVLYYIHNKWIALAISLYASVRVFEVIVYQMNVLLFDRIRAERNGDEYQIESITRLIILLLHNLAEIVFWFSTFYITIDLFSTKGLLALSTYYIESFLCFATSNASGKLTAGGFAGLTKTFAFTEVCSGLFVTLLTLARFLGALPQVVPRKKY